MKWLLGTLLLLVVAVALRMELLIYTAYVLLAVLVVSRALARRWIEGLAAERECSRLSARVGDKVAVGVTVINQCPAVVALFFGGVMLPCHPMDIFHKSFYIK